MGYTVSADAGLMNMGASNAAVGLQGIVNAYNAKDSKYSIQRDLLQQKLIDDQNLEEQDIYNKINTLPDTPHSTLNSNIENYWTQELNYAYDIKTLINNGKMGSREGNALISKINTDMDTYTALAPQILAQAQIMKEAIANGSISRANADPMQMMFMGIANNGGNIKLDRDDQGNMYLSGSGTIAGEAWEGNVNLNEIQQYLSTAGNQIARTIPTSQELGLKEIFAGLESSKMLDQYRDKPGFKQVNVDGVMMRQPTKEFSIEGLAKLRKDLMDNPGLFENLFRSETAIATWSDIANANISADQLNGKIEGQEEMIPDPNCELGLECPPIKNPDYVLEGKENWGRWDINDEEKRNFMKGKLIDKMLAENLDKNIIGELKLDTQHYDAINARISAGSGLPDGVDPNNPCGHLKGEAQKACTKKQRIDAVISGTAKVDTLNALDGVTVVSVDGEWQVSLQSPPKWDQTNQRWIPGKGTKLETALNLSKPEEILQQLYDATGISEFGGSTVYSFSPDGKSYRSGPMIDWNAATQPQDQTFGGEGNTFQGVMDGIQAEIDTEIKAAEDEKRKPKIMDWKKKLDKKIGGTPSQTTEVSREDGSTYFETTPASGGDTLRSVWADMGVNIETKDGKEVVTIDKKIASPLLTTNFELMNIIGEDLDLNDPAEFKHLLDIMANVSVQGRKQEDAYITQLKNQCKWGWDDVNGKCKPKPKPNN